MRRLTFIIFRTLNALIFPLVKLYWLFKPRYFEGVKVVLVASNEFLLVKHPYGSQKMKLPGGKIKDGEKKLAAAAREMKEELGLQNLDLIDVGLVEYNTQQVNDKVHVFKAEILRKENVSPNMEIADLYWFPINMPPYNKMSSITKLAVEKALSA